jgi:hypothetical protein
VSILEILTQSIKKGAKKYPKAYNQFRSNLSQSPETKLISIDCYFLSFFYCTQPFEDSKERKDFKNKSLSLLEI